MRACVVLMLGALAIGLGCGAKGKGNVDTTKDVYRDDEAPKVIVYVENGVAKETPWEKVPAASRWLVVKNEDGTYHHRVPIIREEITSVDKQGRPVPPKDGWNVHGVVYGLNPKYVVYSTYANGH